MRKRPAVSVVVPCFNAERYVASTLTSILAQQGCELEVIAVDDGSSDSSADLIEREFPQVRLIRQPNGGVASARNAGIRAARGEWIAFCDADDLWLPDKLASQFQAMAAADCRMSYTAWAVWNSAEARPDATELAHLTSPGLDWRGASGWIYTDLLLDCVVWTSTVLAHRSLFDEAGQFDAALRIGEDYDLWLRMSRITRIERVSQPLALYRQHPSNITRSAPRENYRGLVVQRAVDAWGLHGPDGRSAAAHAVREALARSWSDYAYSQLQAGQRVQARQSLKKALRLAPAHWPSWKLLLRAWLSTGVST